MHSSTYMCHRRQPSTTLFTLQSVFWDIHSDTHISWHTFLMLATFFLLLAPTNKHYRVCLGIYRVALTLLPVSYSCLGVSAVTEQVASYSNHLAIDLLKILFLSVLCEGMKRTKCNRVLDTSSKCFRYNYHHTILKQTWKLIMLDVNEHTVPFTAWL